ncbi:MAG: class I SAM-dependent RNA methyltransferase [Candidatus Omnitrophica bacterium]|nr:class I SAM-dependent RNA methyltransferase [Candidatus Omnitrophota bacterium]
MQLDSKNTVLITCARGLTPYLCKEVENLGHIITSSHETGLTINASIEETMLLNFSLRTALNILYLLKEFRCLDPQGLYKQISTIPWEEIIPENEYFSVVSTANTRTIKNTMFANQKVKDAIVDRFMKKFGKRPNSGPDRDNIVINLFWKGDRCWLYLNTSGKNLSIRNYRKIPLDAPMQETLAAAVILASGYNGSQNLVNPMCGSGTLAIEAALIALNAPAGLLRNNFSLWTNLRAQSLSGKRSTLMAKIIATDIDPNAIIAARKNAQAAQVEHLIEFHACDFRETPLPEKPGIIIFNPPYGERIGRTEDLENTYKEIGDFFKQKCSGYSAYIFTGNIPLAKNVGLKTSQRLEFFNADIECRLLKYVMYSSSNT